MSIVPESQIVAAFLAAEFNSARFGPGTRAAIRHLGIAEEIITDPHWNDPHENQQRGQVLERLRGYLSRKALFSGLPRNMQWSQNVLLAEHLPRLQYLNSGDWGKFCGNEPRSVAAGARNILQMPPQENPACHVRAVISRIQARDALVPIIVVSDPQISRIVILEGNVRATAYADLMQRGLVSQFPVFVGISPDIGQWNFF